MSCCGVCIETHLQAFCDLEDRHEGLHETRVDGCLWQRNDEACKHYDWENRRLPRDSDQEVITNNKEKSNGEVPASKHDGQGEGREASGHSATTEGRMSLLSK